MLGEGDVADVLERNDEFEVPVHAGALHELPAAAAFDEQAEIIIIRSAFQTAA